MTHDRFTVWRSSSRRAAVRAVIPGLAIDAVLCSLFVAENGARGLLIGGLMSLAFTAVPVVRAAHWYLSISRRELLILDERLRVVSPGGSVSIVWNEIGSVSLYTGDRWPEWSRWATFAAITVSRRDRWKPELEFPHLFAMSDHDMDTLDMVLAGACEEHSIPYQRWPES